jgi:hypothetical protein
MYATTILKVTELCHEKYLWPGSQKYIFSIKTRLGNQREHLHITFIHLKSTFLIQRVLSNAHSDSQERKNTLFKNTIDPKK